MQTTDKLLGLGVGALLVSGAWAQVTQRVSLASGGAEGSNDSAISSISVDGRYVAFMSYAANLVPGDTNGFEDVFVRDRQSGITERVSVGSGGVQGGGGPLGSTGPSISAHGRYVAFTSAFTNLVPADTNSSNDVFIRDRQSGTTERVSVDSGGVQGNGSSYDPSISAEGRFVAFTSDAPNLVPGDTNGVQDIFVHDRQIGTTERVSVSSGGVQTSTSTSCWYASISADGRYVAFVSDASNLVPGDTNGTSDIFVRDRQNGTTERVNVDSGGVQGNFQSDFAAISADGRYVAFLSSATNLVRGDTNETVDVFVRDRQGGTTERVSVDSNGSQGNGDNDDPSISADGRYVAFSSAATNLIPGDTNDSLDVFARDRQFGTTERVSVGPSGAQGNSSSGTHSYATNSISADGRYVAFLSDASNLAPGDMNGSSDIFVRDNLGSPSFTSLCDPGVGSVRLCPCANPPGGGGRGCDNSSGTGGAVLSASGGTYLSSDSLVLTTSGERLTALSIVMQGNGVIPHGVLYGQGVRCVGGTIIRRLFIKSATAGSITAPDFEAGDPTASARSGAKGDVIQPGQSRWYLVYYRDPIVLGGCPAGSTFNATQTGRVDWSF